MEIEPTALASGQLVANRFRLHRSLGSGAMGAVFAALDEHTGETRAIKVVHPHVAKAAVNAERFRREVTLVQQVGHPGIVRVFDAGHDPDIGLFMVMELLQGVTFRPPLTQGDLTVAQALEVVGATLDALQAAHHLGIVHRDLKPDNIFLHAPEDESPLVKLLDFGVARQLNAAGITTTNMGLGTPHFMAPEQATDARSVTAASDVWSAGVMLYYILSGALPFDGDGPYDTVLKACTLQHVSLDRRAPDVDYRLVDIVETCLEKDPEERFQDAGELYEVLVPVITESALRAALSSQVAAEPRPNAHVWADHDSLSDRVRGSDPQLRTSSVVGYASTEPARHSAAAISRPAPLPIPEPRAPRPADGAPSVRRWRLSLAALAALAVVVGLGLVYLRPPWGTGAIGVDRVDAESVEPTEVGDPPLVDLPQRTIVEREVVEERSRRSPEASTRRPRSRPGPEALQASQSYDRERSRSREASADVDSPARPADRGGPSQPAKTASTVTEAPDPDGRSVDETVPASTSASGREDGGPISPLADATDGADAMSGADAISGAEASAGVAGPEASVPDRSPDRPPERPSETADEANQGAGPQVADREAPDGSRPKEKDGGDKPPEDEAPAEERPSDLEPDFVTF